MSRRDWRQDHVRRGCRRTCHPVIGENADDGGSTCRRRNQTSIVISERSPAPETCVTPEEDPAIEGHLVRVAARHNREGTSNGNRRRAYRDTSKDGGPGRVHGCRPTRGELAGLIGDCKRKSRAEKAQERRC